tara:strand:- start:182 stop:844 length:663 start_codon:yes stop_codon:yes gene_type:complete
MSFKRMYEFLAELQENNSKEWMDANRSYYHSVRDNHIKWLDQMSERLAKIDPNYTPTSGKKGINRINNNLMFHPNKPTYKDHFGAGLDQFSKQGDFYIHLGVNESFIAGGYYKPKTEIPTKIREAIDYDGEQLRKILDKPSFKKYFNGLIKTGDELSQTPKGFDPKHQHIDLLKYKTFAVETSLNEKLIFSNDFDDYVIAVYLEMLPFRRYLNRAVTFES